MQAVEMSASVRAAALWRSVVSTALPVGAVPCGEPIPVLA